MSKKNVRINYYSVGDIRKLHRGMKVEVKDLEVTSDELALPPRIVYDNESGRVNTYHADVWEEIYPNVKLQ
jgi:hypothetical protein